MRLERDEYFFELCQHSSVEWVDDFSNTGNGIRLVYDEDGLGVIGEIGPGSAQRRSGRIRGNEGRNNSETNNDSPHAKQKSGRSTKIFHLSKEKISQLGSATGGRFVQSDLVRACGRVRSKSTVLDIFGGFGVDAISLAACGWQVISIEHNPIVWLLAKDLAKQYDQTIDHHCADGIALLNRLNKPATDEEPKIIGTIEDCVVYLDPMFSQRKKKALPSMSAQLLRQLDRQFIAENSEKGGQAEQFDVQQCLESAREFSNRVVLKRRAKDPVLAKPSMQYKGHSIRFDVYCR